MRVDVDAEGAELEGGQSPLAVQRIQLVAGDDRIGCGVDAGIDPDPVAGIAAEQHVDRNAECLG